MVPLTEVINFCQSNAEELLWLKKYFVLKILLTRRKILLNILSKLIDQYVVFTYTETMLRNAFRKRSCNRFVRKSRVVRYSCKKI